MSLSDSSNGRATLWRGDSGSYTGPDTAFPGVHHGEIIYGDTRWIEDDCPATFSEYIFLYPACLMISHWLTENAELNSLF